MEGCGCSPCCSAAKANSASIPRLLFLAVAFTALCAASATWSIVPRHSLRGAGQLATILAGALLFLGGAHALPGRIVERLAPAIAAAIVVGAAIIAADTAAGCHLLHWLGIKNSRFEYNRGTMYSLLLFWPVLGWWVTWRRGAVALILVAAMVVTVAVGMSTTAKLAAVAAAAAAGLAWWAPRLVEGALAASTVAVAAILPFGLRVVEGFRSALVPVLKNSALHRMEIWDYMSARSLERPFLGWGLWSSEFLPIHPEELRQYVWADAVGSYPHNQWLQLWVEVGPMGVAPAVACVLIAVRGARTLSARFRPFAYATIVSALVVTLTDFQMTTDSWWAALAAAAFLVRTLGADAGRAPHGWANSRISS